MKLFALLERSLLSLILVCIPLSFYHNVHDPDVIRELLFKIMVSSWTLLYVIETILIRRVDLPQGLNSYAVLLLFILSALSLLLSDYKAVGSGRLELIFYSVIFYFLVSHFLRTQDAIRPIMQLACLPALVLSAYGILQWWGIDFVPQRDLSRPFATLGHPSILASYLICTIPWTVSLLPGAPHWSSRCFYVMSSTTQSACLLLTLSRAAIASVVLTFLLLCLVRLKNSKRIRQSIRQVMQYSSIFLVSLFSVGVVVFLLLTVKPIPQAEVARLTAITEPSALNTLGLRLLEWQGAAQTIKRSPILGNGIGTFSIFFPDNQPPEFASISVERNEFLRHAHNEFLEVWCEAGIVAAAVFTFILISTLTSGVRLLNKIEDPQLLHCVFGLLGSLMSLTIHICFDVTYHFVTILVMFWFVVGALNGLYEEFDISKSSVNLGSKAALVIVSISCMLLSLFCLSIVKATNRMKAERYFYESLVKIKSGDIHEALEYANLSISYYPFKPEVYYKKGYIESKLCKWNDAIRTYNNLDKMHPNFFYTYYNMSLCYLKTSEIEKSITFGMRQIELYPTFEDQYYLLSVAHSLNNDNDKASMYMSQYISLSRRVDQPVESSPGK